MGKKDGTKTSTAGPQIDPNIVYRIANPPKRGVDSNLAQLVSNGMLKGSVAAKFDTDGSGMQRGATVVS